MLKKKLRPIVQRTLHEQNKTRRKKINASSNPLIKKNVIMLL